VCSDYTKIFEIANKVETETISGYTKQNGTVDTMSHAWCASKIDNHWCLQTQPGLDMNNGKFVNTFDDRYFKVNPSDIIASHMPYDYMWQFTYILFKSKSFIMEVLLLINQKRFVLAEITKIPVNKWAINRMTKKWGNDHDMDIQLTMKNKKVILQTSTAHGNV
jgi:hypothetical protein